jgi:O-antigen ligase
MIPGISIATPPEHVSLVSESRLTHFSRWALYITVACLPLYVVRWKYGPIPTTLLETLIIITVGLYVVGRWREGQRRPVWTHYEVPIALLLVAGAIAVVVAKDHRGALGLYRAYFVEAIAVFYVAVDLIRRSQEVQRVVLAFAAGSSLFALLNVIVFTQALIAHNVHVGTAPNALYGDANYVAMYLEPPVAMAVGLVLFSERQAWRLTGGAWLLFTGVALMLMFSKGSYLAIGALVLVVAVTVPRRWGVPVLAGSGIAGFLVSQIPLVAERLSLTYVSIGGRESMFRGTLQMLEGSPIFGFGLGGYTFLFRGVNPEIYPHNIGLTFWVEVGLLGLIAFAFMLFALLWQGWRAWPRAHGFYRPAVWGASAALVMWTVHGLVDSPYWKNDMSVEFWILAALVVVVARTLTLAPARPSHA